jgi:uncharacterized protein (UPF0264 family)
MTKWLASINSLDEAHSLVACLPDILDMKDPSKGALGALSVNTVADIVRFIDGRCQTSATVGDLEMKPEVIRDAIIHMASSGVDYVKIGLFPDDNWLQCLHGLAETLHKLKTPVIAVLFADKPIQIQSYQLFHDLGFAGIMVDTATKNGLHLIDHWDLFKLQQFVKQVTDTQLLCGLAGALRYEDIAVLSPLGADYLGFRSALCVDRQRTARLDVTRAQAIKKAIEDIN